MTVKRRESCAVAKCKDRNGASGERIERSSAVVALDHAADLHFETPEDGRAMGGLSEAPPGAASSFHRPAAARRDKVKEKAIDAAYRRSKTLARTSTPLRIRWSILGEAKLATVFGSYVRGDDVFKIDLSAIVNVDEWLERDAALALAELAKDTAEIEDHRQQIAWIESQMADYPAHSIFGVICKLMIWRRKNRDLLASTGAGAEMHRLAYAAYADLIRMTGFLSVACAEDREDGVL